MGPGHVRADASGLRNMRERAVLAGGMMVFGPAPQRGTRIDVRVPVGADDGEAEDADGADVGAGTRRENEEGWDEISDR